MCRKGALKLFRSLPFTPTSFDGVEDVLASLAGLIYILLLGVVGDGLNLRLLR